MQLEGGDIQEFKKLYEEAFAEKITDAEAEEMASRVMTLYELLALPLPSVLKQRQAKDIKDPSSIK